jgi:hypothetical protein
VSISVPENFEAETESYPRELCEITNLICEWSRMPKMINKFTYGVFLPKEVGTLTTLFTINTEVIHRFAFGTHRLSKYEVRIMIKGTIVLLKVLCALRIKENIHKPVCQITRFQWNHVAKMA